MVQNKSGRTWMARRPYGSCGLPTPNVDSTPTSLSLLCTYTKDRPAVRSGPRLMVFIHTELNDTTGGGSERFCKKIRTHTTARTNAAAPILVDARGNGEVDLEAGVEREKGTYLNVRCLYKFCNAWKQSAGIFHTAR